MENFWKIIFSLIVLLAAFRAGAQMSGAIYKIDSDSINSGGADYSAFGNFQLADTVGEIAIGESTSTNYQIGAGYRQMEEGSISMSISMEDLILNPDLGGVSGGVSDGSTNVVITTDNPAGYHLYLQSEDSPAMRSLENATINDYTPAGVVPDFNFNLPLGQAVFAFTPEGEDVDDRYRDNGVNACGVENGSVTASRCWDGLSTSTRTVAWRGFSTPQTGATTTLRFSVGIGANTVQLEGSYWATTTVTAIAL